VRECGLHLQDGIIGGSSGELAAGGDPFAQMLYSMVREEIAWEQVAAAAQKKAGKYRRR
jgi:hypothetical protein